MAHTYLITEGSVFVFNEKNYVLKERGLKSAKVEGPNGEETLTKEDCPELFQQLMVG